MFALLLLLVANVDARIGLDSLWNLLSPMSSSSSSSSTRASSSASTATPRASPLPSSPQSCESNGVASNSPVSSASSAVTPHEYVVLFRLNRISLPVDETLKDFAELLRRVRVAFGDDKIRRLTTYVGVEVKSLADARMTPENPALTALYDGDHFMFPALAVGDIFPVQTKDRIVRVRTLSIRPRIFEWLNFLSDDECQHMIDYATKVKMMASTVGAETKGSAMSMQRTSEQAWIGQGQGNDDPVFARVRQRAVLLTRTSESLCEDTQVVHYKNGTYYFGHHDYVEPYEANPYFRAGGNRFVTVLYYLNSIEHGGDTRFPYANSSWNLINEPIQHVAHERDSKICRSSGPGLRVQPRRGSAVLFYNLQEDKQQQGVGDPLTFHMGCPPTHGEEKYMANQWIRNKRVLVNGKMHLYDDEW